MPYPKISVLCIAMSLSVLAHATLPTSAGHVDSQLYPLWVYYPAESDLNRAQQMLLLVEEAWQKEVELGFRIPNTVDDDMQIIPGQRIYLSHGENYAGHVVAISDIEATPFTDCATIAMVSMDMPPSDYPALLLHEFNHAVQMAADCTESPFAYEQTTVALVALLAPEDDLLGRVLPDYQSHPELPLFDYGQGYYHFGAALFSYFLDQNYGAGDGKLLARFWDASQQEGLVRVSNGMASSTSENEPDLLDAMHSVLAADNIDFDEAYSNYASARFFTGANDDGEHFDNASLWRSSEVKIETTHLASELPVAAATSLSPPHPLGMNYIKIDLENAPVDHALRIGFLGSFDYKWSAQLITTVALEESQIHRIVIDEEQQQGELYVRDISDNYRAIFVVTNLGNEDTDSDKLTTYPGSYSYDLEFVECPTPSIDKVEPRTAVVDAEQTLQLHGSGFADAKETTVEIEGEGVEVLSVERVNASQLDVKVRVSADAPLGERHIELKLRCGVSAQGLVTVAQTEDSGCTCRSMPTTGTAASLLMAVGMLWVCRRRR